MTLLLQKTLVILVLLDIIVRIENVYHNEDEVEYDQLLLLLLTL
jgi:hypothetical protein